MERTAPAPRRAIALAPARVASLATAPLAYAHATYNPTQARTIQTGNASSALPNSLRAAVP